MTPVPLRRSPDIANRLGPSAKWRAAGGRTSGNGEGRSLARFSTRLCDTIGVWDSAWDFATSQLSDTVQRACPLNRPNRFFRCSKVAVKWTAPCGTLLQRPALKAKMKRLTSISSAIVGAVLGFVLGIFLAASIGYHESLHIFASAVVLGLLFAALAIVASKKLLARTGVPNHHLFVFFLTCCAGAAIAGFLHIVL